MAEQNKTITKETAGEVKPENITLTEIRILSVDRSQKDVKTWRHAHMAAESPFHANRTRLYDLYEDVLLDGHLTGIHEKRIKSSLNKEILYVDKTGKKIDAMDDTIISEAFYDMKRLMMETRGWGQSGIEFIPGDKLEVNGINRKHIKQDLGIISFEQSGQTGYKYDEIDNVVIVGKRHDLGYLLQCSLYALFKRGNLADWAQFIEIFGQPVRVVKYNAYDNKTKMELRQALDESGGSLTMMIPKEAEFDMKDGKATNANGDLQNKFFDACNNEMSVVVLGVTETTTSSKSSGYAQSKEHSKQQNEIVTDDLRFLVNQLNDKKVLLNLKSYGLPIVEGGKFILKKEFDVAALAPKLTIDMQVSQKVPVGDDYWYETYGIPKPDNYDELKTEMKERQQAADNEDPGPGKPPPGKKRPAAKENKTEPLNSKWRNLRHALTDFFGPALPME